MPLVDQGCWRYLLRPFIEPFDRVANHHIAIELVEYLVAQSRIHAQRFIGRDISSNMSRLSLGSTQTVVAAMEQDDGVGERHRMFLMHPYCRTARIRPTDIFFATNLSSGRP